MNYIMTLIVFNAIMTVGADWAINYQQDIYRILFVYVPGVLGSIGIIIYMNIKLRAEEIQEYIQKSNKARIDYSIIIKTLQSYGKFLMVFLLAVYILWFIQMIGVNILGVYNG